MQANQGLTGFITKVILSKEGESCGSLRLKIGFFMVNLGSLELLKKLTGFLSSDPSCFLLFFFNLYIFLPLCFLLDDACPWMGLFRCYK